MQPVQPHYSRRRFLRLLAGSASLAALAGYRAAGALVTPDTAIAPVEKTDAQWKATLTPPQYAILRREGTEHPFSSPLDHETRPGRYACAGCALVLFPSAFKYDSGTGWPSFFDRIPGRIQTRADTSLFMMRTEYHCARCGGHQGHLFDDGPKPTGQRYCNNGLALAFIPALA